MKKIILYISFLFVSAFSYSQLTKPMNWSGILTDNLGNPIQSTPVLLKFDIVKGNATQVLQFTELHNNVLTDQNGFINAEIGLGNATFGNFDLIDWSDTDLLLRVSVDSGNGLVILGLNPLRAVPYSIKSMSSNFLQFDNNFVTISQDGSNEISFVTDNFQRASISGQGQFQVENLSGTGTREVVANADGQLQRKPVQTKYLSISGAAFVGNGLYQVLHLSNTSGGVLTNVYNPWPLILPHGATITNFKVTFYDNSTRNFELGIVEIDNNSGATASAFNTVFDSNNYPTFASNQVQNIPITKTIDNLNKSYTLALASDEWPLQSGSFDLRFLSVVITYQE
ncbi:hypothetical protein FLCU109888_08985 [Flavobacterium cucumis]|uniref:Uncharacterized protein n=1 Tax=Flavobacterium cucumis TaxID=416016 RepID=A0A1M7ZY11_9FLAO|nr:hypothetical protein [Flavobacterium cucumis]SHO73769.1 hypothetical protein SAMN05443547_2142 [Flavobacterium cucumis]